LKWFGNVERKDDADWMKRCPMMKVEGRKQDKRKMWWDGMKEVINSFGLYRDDGI